MSGNTTTSEESTRSNDDVLEPTEIDETRSMELRILSSNVSLKASPVASAACTGCTYYLEPTADLSYCWHPALRILVGGDWWCECWEPTGDGR
jgi:hypothetical protein